MNLVGIITRDEAKLLISKETGRTVEGDGEITLLHSDDLAAIKAGDPDNHSMYFGHFQHGSSNAMSVANNKESYIESLGSDITTHATDVFNPPAISKNVMWNTLTSVPGDATDGTIMFYGYKFTLKTQWDVITLGSFANGAGWAIADGINVHSSGTTEATYGATFAAKHYRFTIVISGVTAGSLSIETTAVTIGSVTADGLQVFEFDGDITDTAIYLIPTTDFDGGYDTATIKLEEFNKY